VVSQDIGDAVSGHRRQSGPAKGLVNLGGRGPEFILLMASRTI
jgi:hypothetical protein